MIDLGNYKDYFSDRVGEILTQAIEESKCETESEGLGNTKTPDETIEELS